MTIADLKVLGINASLEIMLDNINRSRNTRNLLPEKYQRLNINTITYDDVCEILNNILTGVTKKMINIPEYDPSKRYGYSIPQLKDLNQKHAGIINNAFDLIDKIYIKYGEDGFCKGGLNMKFKSLGLSHYLQQKCLAFRNEASARAATPNRNHGGPARAATPNRNQRSAAANNKSIIKKPTNVHHDNINNSNIMSNFARNNYRNTGNAITHNDGFYRTKLDDLLKILNDTSLPLVYGSWKKARMAARTLSSDNNKYVKYELIFYISDKVLHTGLTKKITSQKNHRNTYKQGKKYNNSQIQKPRHKSVIKATELALQILTYICVRKIVPINTSAAASATAATAVTACNILKKYDLQVLIQQYGQRISRMKGRNIAREKAAEEAKIRAEEARIRAEEEAAAAAEEAEEAARLEEIKQQMRAVYSTSVTKEESNTSFRNMIMKKLQSVTDQIHETKEKVIISKKGNNKREIQNDIKTITYRMGAYKDIGSMNGFNAITEEEKELFRFNLNNIHELYDDLINTIEKTNRGMLPPGFVNTEKAKRNMRRAANKTRKFAENAGKQVRNTGKQALNWLRRIGQKPRK